MAFKGVDFSQWNGNVDFSAVKNSGIDFAIIRSSYGNVAAYPDQKDWQFDNNVKKAKQAGLSFGIYHYSYLCDIESAKAEARGFVALLDMIQPIPYVVALDVEEQCQLNMSSADLEAATKAFIDIVEGAGYFCALYSYESFLQKYSADFRKRYAIWCANTARKPSIDYGIHQYSFTGRVDGVSGDVDMNTTDIDYVKIIRDGGLNGYPKTNANSKTNNAEVKADTITPFDKYFADRIGVGLDYDGVYDVQCFTKDHYVLMADWTYKAIQDVQIGDKVIGYDNEVNTVVQLHRHKSDVIKVKTDIGDITVTKDHPFYFLDGSFDSILAGDEKKFALFDKRNYDKSGLTDEELKMLGFWLGDGCLARYHTRGRRPEIKITYGEAKVPFIESLNMVSNVHYHSGTNHAFNATIRKREHSLLAEIIFQCYNEKKEKILPLIFTPYEYEKIIEGYCHADGSVKNNSIVVTSTSKSLLLSIQAAAILCGWDTKSIRPMKERKYPVYINGHAVKNLKPTWRMTLTKSSKKVYKQIQEIEYLGEEEVYNIGTDGTHTYICDNYKVHNCFDLANDYSVNLIGGKAFVGMSAYEIYTNFNNQPGKELYERIPNTPEFVPIKGDIMVWGQGIGQWGHVAICTGEGDTTWFNSYDQNWGGKNEPVTLIKHNYNAVLGVLRPKDQTKVLGTGGLKGDANGDGKIDVSDIAKIAAHIKGVKAIDKKYADNADVDGNGRIDVGDIAAVSAHIKGVKAIKQDKPVEKPKPVEKKEIVYVVRKGDTLSSIAAEYGTTWTKIAEDNNIENANLIYVGQKLVIK